MPGSLKHTLFLLLEDQTESDRRARWVRWFLVILILSNVCAVMIETMEEVSTMYRHIFYNFELASVGVFTIEYIARLWVVTERTGLKGTKDRLRYALHPLMLVDMLAILPFYLPYILPNDLIFLRALRLMRLARVLKLGRYSDAIKVFINVIRLKKEQLAVAAFCMAILLVISSSLMYYAEHRAQPAIFGSIPHSLWWAVITLTTVGYGDAYPITSLGRVLGAIISMLGIAMFALPAGILSAGFVEYSEKMKARRKRRTCPKCGAKLDQFSQGRE